MTQRREQQSTSVYLIVGMHRSGTSSIGRLMESVGFDFGDNLLEGIDSINDRGFWEDRDVVALDEHILALYGTSWYDFERLPGKWWEEAKIKDLIGVAETWYQEGFSHEKPIVVKDPRFCRLLPFWKRVFLGMGIQPHIIFVVRHPAEVAASLKRRDGFSLQVGYLLWLSYVIDGLVYSRNLDLSLIDYETLLSHPEKTVARLMQDDVSTLHGLSETEMVELVKKTLDVGSRHQTVKEVLSAGEVHGDVQTLAHELYDELVTANAEQAKALADKYRKRFYRLLDHHKEVLSALQATVNKQVEANQKLTEIGNSHSYALSVIREKDAQLAENNQQELSDLKHTLAQCESRIKELEQSLSANVLYIAKCENRIREQDLGQAENRGYIARCETRITEQDQMRDEQARQLLANHESIQQLQRRVEDQDKGLAENREYIGRCEMRIKEQDAWLAENKVYIQNCEARVREQDNGLHIRDQMLGERLEQIEKQKAVIAGLEQEYSNAKAVATRAQDAFEKYKVVSDSQWKDIQKLLEEKRERLRQRELYISDQARVLETLEKSLSERAVALEVLQQEVEQGRDRIIRLDRELSSAQQQVLHHEQQMTMQDDTITVLTRDLKLIQATLTERDQHILLQKQQMVSVQAHAAALDTEQIALHAQMASAQQNLARYRSYRVVRLIDKMTNRDG